MLGGELEWVGVRDENQGGSRMMKQWGHPNLSAQLPMGHAKLCVSMIYSF